MNEPVNEIVDGIPYPCQPIGCDAGHHLPGCVYAEVDEPEDDIPNPGGMSPDGSIDGWR